MTHITRVFNAETRGLKNVEKRYSGQIFDANTTTLHFQYEPVALPFKDSGEETYWVPYIMFDIKGPNGPLVYGPDSATSDPVFDGYTFTLPWDVTSRISKSRLLKYQLWFVRNTVTFDPQTDVARVSDVDYLLSDVDSLVIKPSISMIQEGPEPPTAPSCEPSIIGYINLWKEYGIVIPIGQSIDPETGKPMLTFRTYNGTSDQSVILDLAPLVDDRVPVEYLPTGHTAGTIPLIVGDIENGKSLVYSAVLGGFVDGSAITPTGDKTWDELVAMAEAYSPDPASPDYIPEGAVYNCTTEGEYEGVIYKPGTNWIWESDHWEPLTGSAELVTAWGEHHEHAVDTMAPSALLTWNSIQGAIAQAASDLDTRVGPIETKLGTIEAGAEVNIIEGVKVNGTALVPDANRAVDVTVPTAVSELANDAGYMTATAADAKYTTKTLSVGVWDPTLTYQQNSVVIKDTLLFISLKDEPNIGHDPDEAGTDWWGVVQGGSGSISGITVAFGRVDTTEYHITHRFHSYDFLYSIRTMDSQRRYVQADVYAEDLNRAKVVLSQPAEYANQFQINLVKCTSSSPPSPEDVIVKMFNDPSLEWSLDNTSLRPMFVQAYNDATPHQEIFGDITQENEGDFNPVLVEFSTPMSGFMVATPATHYYTFTNENLLVYTPGGDQYYAVQVVTEDDGEGTVTPDIIQANGTITIDFNGINKTGYVVIVEPRMAVAFNNESEWVVTHNLGRFVGVQAYVVNSGQAVVPTYNITENACSADFGSASVSGYLVIV